MTEQTRDEVTKHFLRQARFTVWPIALVLFSIGVVLALSGDSRSWIAFAAMAVVVVAFNVYVFAVWRPNLDRRFPPGSD